MKIETQTAKRSRVLQITIIVSVLLHGGLWAAATDVGTKIVEESYLAKLIGEPSKPEPVPTPEPKPPPPKPELPPPNQDKEEEDTEPPQVVFGVTADSVVDDSSVVVRVGNTLMKEQEKEFIDPSKVKPYKAPRKPIKVAAPPRLKKMVPPIYPTLAKRAGKEGRVVLKVLIDRNGRVASVSIVRSNPPGLGFEQSALEAVKKWIYTPPSQGTMVWCYQPIRFTLDD